MTTKTTHSRPTASVSEAPAHVLCYLFGPVSALVALLSRRYASKASVRFHAYHSLLLAAAWFAVTAGLLLIESQSPWFFGTLIREMRFALNLATVLVWACLLVAAYHGSRLTLIPALEQRAGRWAQLQPQTAWSPATGQ